MTLQALPWLLMAVMAVLMASVVKAKLGFEKELDMDAQFPANVVQPDPSIPVGHMRPLGWQRRPDGPIDEVDEPLSTMEFFHNYVSTENPVVMRKSFPESTPIFDNWKDDVYLLNQYGQVNVSVRVKTGRYRGKVMTAKETMTVRRFLSEYKFEEWYLTGVTPIEMMEEIPLAPCVRCGTISERLWSSQLWMSSGGTSSRVHSHEDHLLHCVLFGRRDFIVVEPIHKKGFDWVPDYSGSSAGHSDMNTEWVDMYKYKGMVRIPWTWASLRAGDCIFVPAGYVHHVRSYGRSISVTIEFAPMQNFDDTGCTLDDDEFAPLSQASFLLGLDSGILRLANHNLNSDDVRNLMVCLFGKGEAMSFQQFEHFYSKLAANSTTAPPARKVFDIAASQQNQMSISQSGILNLPAKELSRIAEVLNGLHKKDAKSKRKDRSKDEF